jgi:AraC family transcriptional regulator of adaptative response/methylated-DNA-[protein]-cysteine methyltransferase
MGERAVEIKYTTGSSQLGDVVVAATDKGLCAVSIVPADSDAEASLAGRFARDSLVRDDAGLKPAVEFVLARISGRQTPNDVPLDLQGTEFQREVWKQLLAIPAGATRTYGDIATAINRPRATRAVAQACGANPVAVVVPCHRVVMSDGSIGGYSGLPGVKKALLEAEGVDRFRTLNANP